MGLSGCRKRGFKRERHPHLSLSLSLSLTLRSIHMAFSCLTMPLWLNRRKTSGGGEASREMTTDRLHQGSSSGPTQGLVN